MVEPFKNEDVSRSVLARVLIVISLVLSTSAQLASGNPRVPDSCAITQSTLCPWIEAGRLDDLRWPDFSDYRIEVRDFYLPFDYALAWTRENQPTPQALAIIHMLQDATGKGLRPEDYDGPLWADRIERLVPPAPSPSPSDLARFDLALTVSVMRYVSALHSGRINPRQLKLGLTVEHKNYRLTEFLRDRVVQSQEIRSSLEEVEPPHAGYRRAQAALERYLDLAREGEGSPLPPFKKTIRPGDSYIGAEPLAERLRRLGDLPETSQNWAETGAYDGVLVEAVKHFQERHGLQADGSIDRTTYTELVIPFRRRVEQLQLSLERWRWLPPDLPERFIVVNVPEFELRAYDNHHPSLSMRVVVGKAFHGHQTPVFQDEIEYLIFRPFWNVPRSITRKELIPLIKEDPGYLEQHDFEVVSRAGKVSTNAKGEELLAKLRSGELEIRQKPGPGNSLGLVKFVFPNNYAVYLHGTPEKALFSRAQRAYSHGCIRIEDPAGLAAWALRDDPSWTSVRIQEAINGTDSYRVNLRRPIPLLILYGTALVGEDGKIHFFDDIYGQDARLERVLANGYPYSR
jgi:murein L,D-transpeptidase YcbB/YkuD